MVDFELEWCHWGIEMDAVEIVHEQDLRVALSAIAGLGSLAWLANLHHNDVSILKQYIRS